MPILGTAGHIDHGKSTLVQALTGTDPDRLPEEKRRGMTIDLGFAWMAFAPGKALGVIDVPGHRDFVRNLIAGLWGIDAALLVVAADDGWMPQTEEHLQILNFLNIGRGIIAITKIDAVDDPGWLDLVEADIRERVRDTSLSAAPIIRVSAKDGTNLDLLKGAIEGLVSQIAPKPDIAKPYLPVDRAFTIKGSGTVLTGTLIDGSFAHGDEVTILPRGLRARIRGVQCYREKTEKVHPGNRVALNLGGLEKTAIRRGDIVLAGDHQSVSSKVINARVTVLPKLVSAMRNNAAVAVYLGTREILGRIRPLDKNNPWPGGHGFAQILFNDPMTARIGDRFVVRRPAPAATVGGGVVLDAAARQCRPRDAESLVAHLRRRVALDLEELILSELDRCHCARERGLLAASHFSAAEVCSCVRALASQEKLLLVDPWVIDSTYWRAQMERVIDSLAREHSAHPLERGLSHAELASRLGMPREIFDRLISDLADAGKVSRDRDRVALATHTPRLSPRQEAAAAQILELIAASRANPLTRRELALKVPDSEDVTKFMCERGALVELEDEILFERCHYETVKNGVVEFLERHGSISIQQVRELFQFSRKHILPLLNKLDNDGITRRVGDDRVLTR